MTLKFTSVVHDELKNQNGDERLNQFRIVNFSCQNLHSSPGHNQISFYNSQADSDTLPGYALL
jgi:hypothetical protein